MRRNLYLLLAALLTCAVLVAAGCGGDDDNGDSGSSGNNSSDSSGSGGSSSNNANTQQIIDSCKQSVDAAQGLSSDVKSDLKNLCEKAGSGDEEEARKASQDVCVKIVEDTIPSGAARDQAVDACKQNSQ